MRIRGKWSRRLSLFLRRLLLTLALLVAAYVAYIFMTYHRLPDTFEQHSSRIENTVGSGEDYTVMTWNIGYGAYSRDYSFFMDGGQESRARSQQAVYDNLIHCMDVVQAQRPDFLLFQEVDRRADRSWRVDEAEVIREVLKDYQSYYTQNCSSPYLLYPFKLPYGAARSGLLTFSDRDIFRSERYSLPVETDWHKVLDLDRCYCVCRIPTDNGRELCLYNLHLSPSISDEIVTTAQVRMLLQNMAAEYQKGNYVIAGGDFNKDLLGNSGEVFGVDDEAPQWARPIDLSLIPHFLHLLSSSDPDHPVSTHRACDTGYIPGETFVAVTDGFIISENVEALECRAVDDDFLGSDHNPVVLRFRLRELPALAPTPTPEIQPTEEPTP